MDNPNATPARQLIIILTILTAGIYILYASQYADCFRYTAHNTELWTPTVTRGETITLKVDPHVTTVDRYWASSKIILHLTGLKDVQLAPPEPKSWSDVILTSEEHDRQALTFDINYTFPTSIAGPERRTMDGTITGDIIFPEPVGAIEFKDSTAHIHIPVHIQLVSLGEAPWIGSKIMLYFMACLGMLVFVFTPLILLIYDKRTPGNFGIIEPEKRYGMGKWLFMWLLYGGGLLIALAFSVGTGASPWYGDIYTLAGILIALALISLVVTTIVKKSTTKNENRKQSLEGEGNWRERGE